jgi:transposase
MRKTPGKTAAERARYWTKIIEAARAYPAGVLAYLTENNIARNNYYSWFKKLRTKHPEWADLGKPLKPEDRKKSKDQAAAQPEIEVKEKAQRRRFSATYKARILEEIDSAGGGKTASILRREGLYGSHINKWRHEQKVAALEAKKRGPKGNPLTAENSQLRAENLRLQKRLHRATALLDLQKKVSEILGVNLQQTADDE